MELSAHDSVILLGVLVIAAFLLASAQITRVPYPILLVVGGLGIALVPGMPTIELDPELVFVAFLPPLLYGTAFFTSLRELRSNIGAISLLAVGLVLVTTVIVAEASRKAAMTRTPSRITLSWAESSTAGSCRAGARQPSEKTATAGRSRLQMIAPLPAREWSSAGGQSSASRVALSSKWPKRSVPRRSLPWKRNFAIVSRS